MAPHKHHIDKRASGIAERLAAAGDPDELLSTRQTAQLLGTSTQWLEIGRHAGYGPPFIRLSPRRTRYRRRDLIRYLEARTYASTSEYSSSGPTRPGREAGSHVIDGKVVAPEKEAADA